MHGRHWYRWRLWHSSTALTFKPRSLSHSTTHATSKTPYFSASGSTFAVVGCTVVALATISSATEAEREAATNFKSCATKPRNDNKPVKPTLATSSLLSIHKTPSVQNDDKTHVSIQQPRPRLTFLGTGSSTGCPKPLCALLFGQQIQNQQLSSSTDEETLYLKKHIEKSCRVSSLAIQGDPKKNKNYRNNPSILISHYNRDDIDVDHENQKENEYDRRPMMRHVIIDVGKTFREGALRWLSFPPPSIITTSTNTSKDFHDSVQTQETPITVSGLDAIVFTHEHMDAIGGLDDVRGFQKRADTAPTDKQWRKPQFIPIPVYLTAQCYDAIKVQFPYLVPKQQEAIVQLQERNKRKDEDTKKVQDVPRSVAALEYRLIHPFQPFVAGGLRMIPLPVMHGEDLICMGFAFSIQNKPNPNQSTNDNTTTNVLYLSDISRMPQETMHYITETCFANKSIDIVIVDSLLWKKRHPTHFSLEQARELCQSLARWQKEKNGDAVPPPRCFVVGMSCDDFLPHEEMNQWLEKEEEKQRALKEQGVMSVAGEEVASVRLAHDGQIIEM